MSEKPLPTVGRHPEILDLLSALGRGQTDSHATYHALAKIVELYLPPDTSARHAKFLGNMIASMAAYEDEKSAQSVVAEAGKTWAELPAGQPADDAIPWAVAALVVATALSVTDLIARAEVMTAERLLYSEQFTTRLPLPPAAPFADDFV